MPTTEGSRVQLPSPDLDEAPDGPAAFAALISALNPEAALDDQGILSDRPVSTSGSPGIRGRYYFVTGDSDTSQNGVLWRDNGTGWDAVGGTQAAWVLPGEITPSVLTGDQNNYNPTGLSGAAALRLASTVDVNLTGLQGGAKGRMLILQNIGAKQIALRSESSSSTAGNRFTLANDIVLRPKDSVVLRYDVLASRWRIVASNLTLPPGWVSGGVNSDGSKRYGSGFTSSRTSLGHWAITFTPVLAQTPSVEFGVIATQAFIGLGDWPTASGFAVNITDRLGNATDGNGFSFDAKPSGA